MPFEELSPGNRFLRGFGCGWPFKSVIAHFYDQRPVIGSQGDGGPSRKPQLLVTGLVLWSCLDSV